MKLSIKASQPLKQQKSCLIIGVYEDGELTPSGKELDKNTQGFIRKLLQQGVMQGKVGQILPLFLPPHSACEQILLAGCGKINTLTPAGFRKIMVSAVRALNAASAKQASCFLAELPVGDKSLAWKVKQMAECAWEALYRFDLFKSEKEAPLALNEFVIHLPDAKHLKACEQALAQGQAVADGITLTKNLANLPSNICTPAFLAEQARELGKRYASLNVKVLEEKEMRKLGMGAILAVSQGSAQEAKLICLEYKGGKQKAAPVALVGKGITFDTGGNSLKSPENMVGMKYDMCGAATVLGTIKAAAELKLPVNIVGIIAAVENMPGGTAYKPEDILTSMSGQTIEVITTDAEGRLVLSDALTYCERYQPEVVIDIATLTGAVVIALGVHATGLMSNDDALAHDLLQAGLESNDRAWQLPLWDEYQEQIKSPFADMANSGGRSAGSITAGCFLSRFAKKFRWAHLDVAGTAAMMSGTSERMATGRPVAMLAQYLINRTR
ncbi:Cytosol aminopeptidase [Aquicella siphonis]|uniref:Probable cytosol aminopeptidase n=1 Tax=Aquicella siphonis TaxID=254247 RepID=A0A5E4PGT4_9COXI|nr:leucyl aminopeptidase [Aquicella siphonis]VVC75795.1 Cytosol aminopeptidase [Aquicella siphonis]